jgi:hypothetical protein
LIRTWARFIALAWQRPAAAPEHCRDGGRRTGGPAAYGV